VLWSIEYKSIKVVVQIHFVRLKKINNKMKKKNNIEQDFMEDLLTNYSPRQLAKKICDLTAIQSKNKVEIYDLQQYIKILEKNELEPIGI